MLIPIQQLVKFQVIPAKGYKMGQAFPEDFKPVTYVSNELWKKLPLYIQVRYEYTPVDGNHKLKG